MPRYRFVGTNPKSLSWTTPPYERLEPRQEFEVAEELTGPEFEAVAKKSDKAAVTHDEKSPKE